MYFQLMFDFARVEWWRTDKINILLPIMFNHQRFRVSWLLRSSECSHNHSSLNESESDVRKHIFLFKKNQSLWEVFAPLNLGFKGILTTRKKNLINVCMFLVFRLLTLKHPNSFTRVKNVSVFFFYIKLKVWINTLGKNLLLIFFYIFWYILLQ